MQLEPTRSLYTKAWMTFATITLFVLAGAGVTTLVINVASDNPGTATRVVWIVVGCGLAAFWLIGTPIAWLWIRNLSYEITDDAVVIHKGILTKVDQNIPFRMITDFRLHRSLYDRWLHIGSIDVQTAGQTQTATGYEGRIAGQAEPAHLHQELRGRIMRFTPARPKPAPEPAAVDDDLHAILEEVKQIHALLER